MDWITLIIVFFFILAGLLFFVICSFLIFLLLTGWVNLQHKGAVINILFNVFVYIVAAGLSYYLASALYTKLMHAAL